MDEQLIRKITTKVLQEMTSATAIQGCRSTNPAEMPIPIGISARHVHLCKNHLEVLFGPGHELTFHKELMGGQFAAAETVNLVGKNTTALKARILGPLRPTTQVEISTTDSRTLGIQAPLRDSGDIASSGAITIIGPKGAIYLTEGCIIARRHIHMPPDKAASYNLNDNAIVSVELEGPRGGILHNVLVRVDKTFTLEMHIDTDEANALGFAKGTAEIIIE